MSDIGQIERKTQNRVVALLCDQLGYSYAGNLEEAMNSNVRAEVLSSWLTSRGCADSLVTKALDVLDKTANDSTKSLYDRNRNVYELLRYGAKVKADVGAQTETVWLIDWSNPHANVFEVAEEVTVHGRAGGATKRPDVVLYVNGIALGVIELKRSTVSVSEGIRQNLTNQSSDFIEHFFSTMQWVMAGNDTQGLRYATIQTPEKYWLTWKEDSPVENPLDRALLQICAKERFLELIHDFTVFDAGTKKLCRPNQYFGVRAAQTHVRNREGGIIWHTQGSGKSLTMVWLAKWIRENIVDPRVVIITDRTELDEQIEKVFKGVSEDIHRTRSGADLIEALNTTSPWLICSLIHKFGRRNEGDAEDVGDFIEQLKKSLPVGFQAKGNLFVFVDECHRTQSGQLHRAMKEILPQATLIGFTGTPLLKTDKARSIEIFGLYIHTYKFDEAVRDGVVVDLRYEARDIDQRITSQDKIDQWFAAKTAGLNDIARAELKKKWGTMQQVLSAKSRLEQIVADIVLDMATRPRLMDDRGNALLVSSSIYEACIFYELFQKTTLRGKCGIVTSYKPTLADVKGEDAGEGETLPVQQYNTYKQMLADWFGIEPDKAVSKSEEYEMAVKKKFIEEPGQMKLLIVVDKLLTGFDAPSATYLYIDKQMRDHGLFQAICRVNRLDGEDKDYGYIIDYKDLFKSLEYAVKDYTSGALDNYDKKDVEGLLKDRIALAKQDLEDALETVRATVEPVENPKDQTAYLKYFCAEESGNAVQLKANEEKRLSFYKAVGGVVRAFAAMAGDEIAAGYTAAGFEAIRNEIARYEAARQEVKLASGDYVDLKMYEPAMRHLIDTYIKADESEKLSTFDDVSFLQLLVDRGADAVEDLPEGLKKKEDTVAEVIENNVRKLIIDQQPINPKYYDKMSELLDALIEQRRNKSIDYKKYLEEIAKLAKQVIDPAAAKGYPANVSTPGKRALYDLLDSDETLAIELDSAIHAAAQDGWRGNVHKRRKVRIAIEVTLGNPVDPDRVHMILELVSRHSEY
jgi:type I restriction enzyme R subunit